MSNNCFYESYKIILCLNLKLVLLMYVKIENSCWIKFVFIVLNFRICSLSGRSVGDEMKIIGFVEVCSL